MRGHHSCGIYTVDSEKNASLVKSLDTIFEMREKKEYGKAIKPDLNLFIGHARYATKGAKTIDNSHPFEIGNLVGAHNGVVRACHKLLDGNKFDVDSQALFNNINHEGMQDTAKKLDAAFALTWYDKSNNTFNVARNKERPLFFVFSKDMRTMFWASEDWMLLAVMNRLKYEHFKVTEVEPFTHYSMAVPSAGYSDVEKFPRFTQWKQEKFEEFVAPPVYQPINSGNSVFNNYAGYYDDCDESHYYRHNHNAHTQGSSVMMGGNREKLSARQRRKLTVIDGGKSEKKPELDVDFATARALVGKRLVVTTVGRIKTKKEEYFSAVHITNEGKRVIVRCHPKEGSALYNALSKQGEKYYITPKSTRAGSGNNNYHVVADLRSVTKIVEHDAKKGKKDPLPSMVDMIDSLAEANKADAENAKILIDSQNKNVSQESKYYMTYNDEVMTGADIKRLHPKGCTWCSNPPDLNMVDLYIWVGHNEYVCDSCKSFNEVKELINDWR